MSEILSVENAIHLLREAERDELISKKTSENAHRWLSEDPYEDYQDDIKALIAAKDWKELTRLFWQVVPFGTGGRRGTMGEFGSATINNRTIAESAFGLADYLKRVSEKEKLSAVIAHDTRNRSPEFAKLTATTLAAQGLKVYFFIEHRSTPTLSFAVRHLGCDVGVVISASHNPPSDNGFKAYWSHGGQVLHPHDEGIIDCVYQAHDIPQVEYDDAVAEKKIVELDGTIDQKYLDAVCGITLSENRQIKALYSPMHGVGETNVFAAIQQAGFGDVAIFEPQREPNGNFPNVPDQLPNPERPEVYEPLEAEAAKLDAALILASDPDADRLGISVRDKSGKYVPLTGNQVGALLADYVIRKTSEQGKLNAKSLIIETVVTTGLISAIGNAVKIDVVDNLPVGFKYIGQMIDKKRQDGGEFLFGAEESLGYLAGDYARDKDATVAALWLLELAGELQVEEKTLHDRLDELYVEHGYFLEDQFSKSCDGETGRQKIDKIMKAFRETPPAEIGDLSLDQVRDYAKLQTRELPSNKFRHKLDVPEAEILYFESPRGPFQFKFAVRPSGTEPKMKFYLFARMDCSSQADLPKTRERTAALMKRVEESLEEWATTAENKA